MPRRLYCCVNCGIYAAQFQIMLKNLHYLIKICGTLSFFYIIKLKLTAALI